MPVQDIASVSESIRLALSTIDDRLSQNISAEEKTSLLQAKENLALELSELAEGQLTEGAKKIAVAGQKLQAVISSANGSPIAHYWQRLTEALNGLSVQLPSIQPSAPRQAAETSPRTAPSEAPVISGNKWGDLVAYYRTRSDITESLRVVTLSQWILESGRGDSALAKQHLNFGGLKYRDRMFGYARSIRYTGSDGETTDYCAFDSLAQYVDGYWHFIKSGPAYSGWEKFSADSAGYLRHIAPSYAGDASYVSKVLSLFAEATDLLGFKIESQGAVTSAAFMRVAVVVGHNSRSPGAGAISPISKSEFAFNSAVADHMKREAAQYNVVVEKFFRQPDPSLEKEIGRAYQEAKAWGPHCAVELHFNSADDPAATGTEVLIRPGDEKAQRLASAISSSVRSSLGLKLRAAAGIKTLNQGQRGWISVTALPEVPSVLLEPFFGSCAGDCLKVAEVGEEGIAIAYLRGLRQFTLGGQADV